MGDENTVLTAAEARHLLRRTGFGAAADDVDRIVSGGETRGQTADRLVGMKPKVIRPNGKDPYLAHNKWIRSLVKTRTPLNSKLALFWHDHFATAVAKVGDVGLMADQIKLFHKMATGNFKDFVKAVNRNAAMMEFLDTVRNFKDEPNENYARELQELFTLGVNDLAGNPNYVQDDVVQIARAFTGWYYDRHGDAALDPDSHDFMADFPERGPKVIYQQTGGFGSAGRSYTANGEGAGEIDAVIDIIFQHSDTDGKKTVARRVAHRLLEFYAHPDPATSVVDEVVAASGFDTSWELAPLVRAILVHDDFYTTMAPAPFGATSQKSVKWPVDYVVTTLRLLDLRLRGRDQSLQGGNYSSVYDHLTNMGQVLLDPPSVFGWDWETGWISTATLLARYTFARDATSARGHGSTSFRPDRLIDLSLSDPGEIVDAVTDLLGVTDQITAGERDTLIGYATDGGVNPTLNLGDEAVRNTKLNGLFALVLQSPAYQLH